MLKKAGAAVLDPYYIRDLTVLKRKGKHSILHDTFPFSSCGSYQKYVA